HPAAAGVLSELAASPVPHAVVWLDELQRYLDVGNGLTGGIVRTLLDARTVLVGTIWPEEYRNRIARRRLDDDDHRAATDREVLHLAQVLDVADSLSAAETGRARRLAATDGRLRVALDSGDGGLTQVLAAGPELVRWWQQAPSTSKALITAAVH